MRLFPIKYEWAEYIWKNLWSSETDSERKGCYLWSGNRRWARVVGYALHANPNEQEIPCYRVVTKDGRVSKAFAFGGENRQMELLVADGVEFEDGHVVMEKYQWDTPFADFGIR